MVTCSLPIASISTSGVSNRLLASRWRRLRIGIPAQAQVKVYCKLDDPGISCLEPALREGTVFLIGMVCIVVGLQVVVSGTIAGLRKPISGRSGG